MQGVREVSYKKGTRGGQKYLDKGGVSQNGVFAFHFCFSLFKTHLRKLHPAPNLWSDHFHPLALNMREHLKPLFSLDTLFPSYLNQSKRVVTGAALGPAQPGHSWAPGVFPASIK